MKGMDLNMQEQKMVKNTIWNSIGILTYFACQWLMTIVVVWLSDDYVNSGNLGLAMNITNFFATVALYNVRFFQVSDIKGEYNDKEYIISRVLSCVAAILLCAVFVFIVDFSPLQRAIILCYMVFRIVESFIEVLHGIDQKNWRMDYIGISMVMRGISMFTAFVVLVWFFDLLTAFIGMSLITLIIGLLYDVQKTKKLIRSSSFAWEKVFSLLKRCFPLMLVMLSGAVIISYSRFMVERVFDEEFLGIYISVTAPTLLIQVALSTVFPTLSNLFTGCLERGDKAKFMKIFAGFSIITVVVTLAAAGVSGVIGQWGLKFLYRESILTSYAYLLPGAVFVVGLTAFLWFMNMVFASIRDIKGVFISNMAGVIVCIATVNVLLVRFELPGANYVMIISQGVAVLCMLVRLFWIVKKDKSLFDIHG
jgi:O-antigen/teichoic acid export membrane protein